MDGLSVLRVVFLSNLSPDFSYHDKVRGKEGDSIDSRINGLSKCIHGQTDRQENNV